MFVFFSCECGNCSVASLQNISECYCCYYYITELEDCQDSKKSDLVLEDIGADVILKCVTQYPGIKPVWPLKWSFKISSGQIQNYLSAVPTDCCCFSDQTQQRLHEPMEKRLFQIRLA